MEELNNKLKAQLDQFKADFEGGIVEIDERGTKEGFEKALKTDRTAGRDWRVVEGKLLDNNAFLLKVAARMPIDKSVDSGVWSQVKAELRGLLGKAEKKPAAARLIGVYPDGKLAIRQKSLEITNARWTVDWNDGDFYKGSIQLLPHAEAIALTVGRWANYEEILDGLIANGFDTAGDGFDKKSGNNRGLAAASEVVMGKPYLRSSNGREDRHAVSRSFLTSRPDTKTPHRIGTVSYLSRDKKSTPVYHISRAGLDIDLGRSDKLGAVLWVIG